MEHLNGEICLKTEGNSLFHVVGHMAHGIWLRFCEPESVHTICDAVIVSRHRIVVMEWLVQIGRVL